MFPFVLLFILLYSRIIPERKKRRETTVLFSLDIISSLCLSPNKGRIARTASARHYVGLTTIR